MQTELFKEQSPRYVIVSPVKDEARNIDHTLQSVINQTLQPVLWVIVDDGSSDDSPKIIRRCANAHPFIHLVHNPHAGERKLAFGEVRAFNWGCKFIGQIDYDFIVKLDCDLSFDADYFKKIMKRFGEDKKLGIASGVYLERNNAGDWKEIVMPPYHAAGASKVMRRTCFEEIGGFVPAPGWDTIDEIKAMTRGWKTGHFVELKMRHHKREGSSIGTVRTGVMQGEAYYRTGGSKLFFVFKVLHRLVKKPYFVSGLSILWGYLRAMMEREQLLVTESESSHYKALLLGRLKTQVKSLIQGLFI